MDNGSIPLAAQQFQHRAQAVEVLQGVPAPLPNRRWRVRKHWQARAIAEVLKRLTWASHSMGKKSFFDLM